MSNAINDLVLYLKLDEMYNATVVDVSGNSHDGTIVGDPQLVADDQFGTCLRFDGAGDYVDLGNSVDFQITGNQTIEMWLMPADFDLRRNPYAKAYGGEGTITQEPDGTLRYFYGTTGGNSGTDGVSYQTFSTADPLPLNQWTHVAIVRDLDNEMLTWFINGIKNAEAPTAFTPQSGSNPVFIGNTFAKI